MGTNRTARRSGLKAIAVTSALLLAPAVPALAAVPTSRHGQHPAAPGMPRATIAGVVIARQPARRAVIVASRSGAVQTLRVTSSSTLGRLAPGTEVRAVARRLGDGTYRLATLRTHGRTGHARLRATVVRSSSEGMLLAGGGSVLAVSRPGASGGRLPVHSIAGSSPLSPGTVVSANVSISGGSLVETSAQPVGQSDLIDLEGVLSSVTAGQLVLAVDNGASTTISVPASLTLPSVIVAGDRVEVVVYYSNQAFSLVTITDETLAASSSSGDGASQPTSTSSSNPAPAVQVEGSVTSITSSSLVVQPGEGAAAVSFAIPSGFPVTGITTSSRVEATGEIVNGVLTLQQLDVQSGDGGDAARSTAPAVEVEGTVAKVNSSNLIVQPVDGTARVTFDVPAGFDLTGVVTGARVQVAGAVVSGVTTLTRVHVQNNQDGNGDGHSSTGQGGSGAQGSTGQGGGD